jgi:DNA ligase-1
MKILNEVEKTSSTKEKIRLLKQCSNEEKKILYLALTPDMVYHVQNLSFPETHNNASNYTVDSLEEWCRKYSGTKALTDKMREELKLFLEDQTESNQKWFYRVFLKDLRLGVDAKSVNKALPGLIPTYDIALADVYEEIKHSKMLTSCLMDVKLDGIRALASVNDGDVYIRSRKGKPIVNFPDISLALAKLPNGVYDGEIYLHEENGFQKLSKYITRDEPASETLGAVFYVFDYLTLDEWNKEGSEPPLETRKTRLEGLFDEYESDGFLCKTDGSVGFVETLECIDSTNVNTILDQALEAGFEGLMIKPKNGFYLKKRSKNILKYKVFKSLEGKIVDFVEGEGRLQGVLGKFVLELPNGSLFGCGSGFTDEEREVFWKDRKTYLGLPVEVKYQELTKDGIPRFPTYLRIRYDLDR